jgi:hypothetical protein
MESIMPDLALRNITIVVGDMGAVSGQRPEAESNEFGFTLAHSL